jgi:hypothetical protein
MSDWTKKMKDQKKTAASEGLQRFFEAFLRLEAWGRRC